MFLIIVFLIIKIWTYVYNLNLVRKSERCEMRLCASDASIFKTNYAHYYYFYSFRNNNICLCLLSLKYNAYSSQQALW
uniref:Secreted protein n=1 Tax=Heterorhabditis bacteriophora TaxID=37862 RepID=A0A1I7WJE1_HETBA